MVSQLRCKPPVTFPPREKSPKGHIRKRKVFLKIFSHILFPLRFPGSPSGCHLCLPLCRMVRCTNAGCAKHQYLSYNNTEAAAEIQRNGVQPFKFNRPAGKGKLKKYMGEIIKGAKAALSGFFGDFLCEQKVTRGKKQFSEENKTNRGPEVPPAKIKNDTREKKRKHEI